MKIALYIIAALCVLSLGFNLFHVEWDNIQGENQSTFALISALTSIVGLLVCAIMFLSLKIKEKSKGN